VPVYLQLEAQVKQAVAAGALRTGEALPSTRKLAATLRINPNTVARAYQDLSAMALPGACREAGRLLQTVCRGY